MLCGVVVLVGACAPVATDWSSLAQSPFAQPPVPQPVVEQSASGKTATYAARPKATVAETRVAIRPDTSHLDGFGACEAAVFAAETREGTPPGLLGAIARVESGRPDPRSHQIRPWPWSIDVDGIAHVYQDRDQAIEGVKAAQAAGAASIDVGCMQVNLQYHPDAFRTLQEAFDPVANAAYAARFLRTLWITTPDRQWMIAAGYYHSHTPELAATYRRLVAGFAGMAVAPACLPPVKPAGLILRRPDPLVVAAGMVLAPPASVVRACGA